MFKKFQIDVPQLAYSGFDKHTFVLYQEEILRQNRKFIRLLNVLFLFLLIGMYSSNLFSSYTSMLTNVQLIFILLYIVEYPIRSLLKKMNYSLNSNFAIWYCMSKIYLFSFFSGIIYNPESTAVTFYISLLGLPILFIQPTWKMTTYISSVSLIFCILSAWWKSPERAVGDIYCCIFCYIAVLCITYWINQLRLRSIQNEQLLIAQRDTDSLTGLYNRLCFNNYITKNTHTLSKGQMTILMIDVDYFKSYNDHYGHLEGDDVLRRLGKYFHSFSKEHGIFFARYGGEEFVAVDTMHSYDQIKEMAEALVAGVQALNIPHQFSNYQVITVSVGYAFQDQTTQNSYSYIELINFADHELYQAKNNGRNRAIGSF